ncbi:MAG TPA: ATP-binding protein, partial [Clostridia bacterium]|nr:ATP-binding protein [Clostridia bacterium]
PLLAGLIISIAAIFVMLSFQGQDKHRVYPVKGVLDLKSWDKLQDGALNLSGQWDFYWGRLLTYKELANEDQAPDLLADVPDAWNSYKLQGKNLPGFGFATYSLKVINAEKNMPLSLRIPTFSTAYELYIDDILISSNGKVSMSKEQYKPEYRPRVMSFTPTGTSFEIIIHAANYTYARGGMWYALDMGTPEQIQKIDRNIVNKDLFLFGALSVMAIYYMSIFLLRREDRSSLYFVFMCLLFACRTVVYGDYLIYGLIPDISYHAIVIIEYNTLVWFPVFADFMVGELFPEEISRKVLKAVLIYASVMTLVFLLTPVSFYTGMVLLIEASAILAGSYAIICAGKALARGRRDSLLVIIGAFSVIASSVHDVFYQNNFILSDFGELAPFGLFIMLLIQSFVLSRRFSEAFKNVNALSRKLLELDKIKDEFLANTSHELRTPLSGILGITEAMLREGGAEAKLSSGQRQDLSTIAGSCRRLANLVNDILDYSKLKHGDIKLDIKPLRLDGIIQTVVKVFSQLSKAKGYDVIFDLPEAMPPVMADENRIIQVFYNLIGNAVKFTVSGYVKVSARKTDDMLEVCVSDTGQGIPEDKLEDIFKSFEQVDTSLTRKHGGTGLGLSITRQLVELQSGRIWVESRLGSGSKFYFTLPIAAESPAEKEVDMSILEFAAADLEEKPIKIQKEGAGTHILLVDDDAVNLQASASLLVIGGYSVTAVNSGKAALEEIRKSHDYSLVVLDVIMPEMSGYEVCRKIRESKSIFDLPVLMLTSKTSMEDVITGFDAGANDYLAKSFEPEELLARVRTLVNLKTSVDKAMAAEVAFMQAQIKPHFLFNTLNTISSFCDTAPEHARQLIDELSNYLRQSFDFKSLQMYVPIEREIMLVKSYVTIEKARFGDSLKVEFDIDGTIKVKIPPLSIQPLVENAIRHGIRKKGGSGTVTIAARNTAEGVLVSVEDNGSGISPDKLEMVLEPDAASGIGLCNIDSRLKALLGKGLTIESKVGKGTRITFLVP